MPVFAVMPFIKSIASRIFGLAIILVGLMIALAGFLLWQVTVLDAELQHISGYYTPLTKSVVDLNEAGLRRRIAFERWYADLVSKVPRPAALAEASKNYGIFSEKITSQIALINELLASPPEGVKAGVKLERVRDGIKDIEASYEIVNRRQKEILDLVRSGQEERAADFLSVVDDLQTALQAERGEVLAVISSVLAESTKQASRRHSEVVWTTVIATVTSVLLGLSVAALVTRRLVRPVRLLMSGIKDVERGDFSVQLPVQTADEIGALTHSFNYFIGEMRLKEELRSTFGKYIDPRILDRVLCEPGVAGADGGRQDMSVSFADLVGFTGIGEHLTPAGVVNLLNRHFTLQAEAIQQHHGVVDKFMGDAVMAFWGPPFTKDGDHALLACQGALHQAAAIVRFRALLPEITGLRRNLPHIDIRIGISTGEVIVGNIGSDNTRSYTVIGDTVNLASRLEQANRFYGTQILICGQTRASAGEAIVAREIDTIIVKGKSETTTIYELLALVAEASSEERTLCESAAAAHAAYRARDWDQAEIHLRKCLTLRPTDSASALLLERISAYRLNPPAADWNGVWVYDVK